MNAADKSKTRGLTIPAELKQGRPSVTWLVLGWVAAVILILIILFLMTNRTSEAGAGHDDAAQAPATSSTSASANSAVASDAAAGPAHADSNVVLTATGYIVPRERLELGPKLAGTVAWIGVDKSDAVRKGQVIARLDDSEYQARVLEAQGRLALAEAELKNAQATHRRQEELARTQVATQQALDDAVRAVDVAQAQVQIARGQLALAHTWLQWCEIESPIDGVVLEKYADQDELVIPQAFGGPNHPSTLLVALADLNDLRVEVDLNESDTGKVFLDQPCRVRPEAHKDRDYTGRVVRISPEADRSKGTLQVEVKVDRPDRFLVPELNARVRFLAE